MNVEEALTIESSEQTAQDALIALQLEVERLRAEVERLQAQLDFARRTLGVG